MKNYKNYTKEIVNGQEVHKVYDEELKYEITVDFEESPDSDATKEEIENILQPKF